MRLCFDFFARNKFHAYIKRRRHACLARLELTAPNKKGSERSLRAFFKIDNQLPDFYAIFWFDIHFVAFFHIKRLIEFWHV